MGNPYHFNKETSEPTRNVKEATKLKGQWSRKPEQPPGNNCPHPSQGTITETATIMPETNNTRDTNGTNGNDPMVDETEIDFSFDNHKGSLFKDLWYTPPEPTEVHTGHCKKHIRNSRFVAGVKIINGQHAPKLEQKLLQQLKDSSDGNRATSESVDSWGRNK